MQNIILKNGNRIHSFIVSKRLLGGDEGQRGLKFLLWGKNPEHFLKGPSRKSYCTSFPTVQTEKSIGFKLLQYYLEMQTITSNIY